MLSPSRCLRSVFERAQRSNTTKPDVSEQARRRRQQRPLRDSRLAPDPEQALPHAWNFAPAPPLPLHTPPSHHARAAHDPYGRARCDTAGRQACRRAGRHVCTAGARPGCRASLTHISRNVGALHADQQDPCESVHDHDCEGCAGRQKTHVCAAARERHQCCEQNMYGCTLAASRTIRWMLGRGSKQGRLKHAPRGQLQHSLGPYRSPGMTCERWWGREQNHHIQKNQAAVARVDVTWST